MNVPTIRATTEPTNYMLRGVMNKYLLLEARLLAVASLAFLCAGASADGLIRTVALQEQLAPGAQGASFRSFQAPRINNQGQVAFSAMQFGPGIDPPQDDITEYGIWAETTERELQLVARADDPAPGTIEGRFYYLSSPQINDDGQILFNAYLRAGIGIGNGTNADEGVWAYVAGQPLRLVVREGNTPPGFSGSRFGAFFGSFQNQIGEIVLNGRIHGGNVANYGRCIWLDRNGELQLVVMEGDIAPGTDGLRFDEVRSAWPADNGLVVFRGSLKGESVNATNDSALWTANTNGETAMIVREGLPAPGSDGATFKDLEVFNLAGPSDAGSFALNAYLGEAGFESGIWTNRDGMGFQLLLRSGDPTPSLPDVYFVGFSNVAMGPSGKIAFRAGLSGLGVNDTNDVSIWSEGMGLGPSIVVREGQPAPGTDDAFFDLVSGDSYRTRVYKFNDAGRIAFEAKIRGENVVPANDDGFWAQDRSGVLRLIAREGDVIDVDDGPNQDLRQISHLLFGQFNNFGQFAFTAHFTDWTSGVFVSNAGAVPEPTAFVVSCTALALALVTRRRFSPARL